MTEYAITDGVLHIRGELSDPVDDEFKEWSEKLLAVQTSDLAIDVTEVTYMVSQYLGNIAMISAEARLSKRSLKVLATGDNLNLLRMVGFDQIMDVMEAPEPPSH